MLYLWLKIKTYYEHKYEAKCNAGMQSYDPYPFVILKCCDLIKFGSA